MQQALIPRLARLKVFRARLLERLVAGHWQADPESSDEPLDDQVNRWLEESAAQLLGSSAGPAVSLYQLAPDRQLLVMSLAVFYFPATEASDDCPAS